MRLSVLTPSGVIFDDDIDYIVVSSKQSGEFAVLENHAPLVCTIDVGTIKIIQDKSPVFAVVMSALLEQQDNLINVIAQEAHIGKDKEDAMQHLEDVRLARLEDNRRRTMDFLKAERELKKNIREAKASKR